MRPLSRISERTWVRVYRADAVTEQGGKCKYCHCPITMRNATADHKVAQIFGGSTSKGNIAASCLDCNRAKGSLTDKEYLTLIKSPPHGIEWFIWMAWSRRRIFLATERACTRISRMVT